MDGAKGNKKVIDNEKRKLMWEEHKAFTKLILHQDTITWLVFSVFMGINSALVYVLISSYGLDIEPNHRFPILIIICLIGVGISWVWYNIDGRSIDYMNGYLHEVKRLEKEYLKPYRKPYRNDEDIFNIWENKVVDDLIKKWPHAQDWIKTTIKTIIILWFMLMIIIITTYLLIVKL